MGKFVLIEGV